MGDVNLRNRTTEEVLDDHLRLAAEHRFDDDIERNVSPDIVVIERAGIFHGRGGVRVLAHRLLDELGDAPYHYTHRASAGRIGFLEWTADAPHAAVHDGVDTFVIENGWIIAQTIRYTVEPR